MKAACINSVPLKNAANNTGDMNQRVACGWEGDVMGEPPGYLHGSPCPRCIHLTLAQVIDAPSDSINDHPVVTAWHGEREPDPPAFGPNVVPPVDRSQRVLTDGSPVTDDHRDIDQSTGMQKDYVVLSEAERFKGFIRPVRTTYRHVICNTTTHMGRALAETYARDPKFYSGTFCVKCKTHFSVDQFVWEGTTEMVGS